MSEELVEYEFDDGTVIEVEEEAIEKLDGLDLSEEVEVEPDMEEVELGDETIEVKADDLETIENFLDEHNKLAAKVDNKEAEIEKLEERVDSLEDLDVDKIVQDRLDLIETARQYVPDFDPSGLEADEIKEQVIQRVDSEFELTEEMEDAYLEARFDGAIKFLDKIKSDSLGSNNLKFEKSSKTKKDSELEKKKKKRKNLRG